MRKIMHRFKAGVALATAILTVASVSPAFAANTVDPTPYPLATNIFDVNSDGNTGFGGNLNLVNSSSNTFGVAGKPSHYNNLTNSSNNTIRSVGIATGTASDINVLNNSSVNTIDGRSNSLTNSSNNTIRGDSNVISSDNIILANSNTITGNFNSLTNSSSNTITNVSDNSATVSGNTLLNSNSNTITGNTNRLSNSNSNTITGNLNQMTNTNSSTISGNSNSIIDGRFAAIVGNGVAVTADNASVVGSNSVVSAPDGSALGSNSVVNAPNSVAVGANSAANRANTVSLGAPGAERQITNVAPGTAGTDGVNMNQFQAANSNTEGMIYRTGALSAALTGIMPIAYDVAAPTQIGVGLGSYHGNTAVAFGVNHYLSDSLLANVGIALSGNDTMFRGGLTWRFGPSSKKIAVDTSEVDNLKSQMQRQQNELEQLKQQVAELSSARRGNK